MRVVTFSSLVILLLTGCRIWDPSFMPAGYSHHHGASNSPPGPEASNINYEYSDEENEKYLAEWRNAVRDLLLKTRAENMNIPQALRLHTDLPFNAFNTSYDYILRENLRSYGHVLSESNTAPTVTYSARLLDKNAILSKDKYGAPYRDVELTLGIQKGGEIIHAVSNIYNLPITR